MKETDNLDGAEESCASVHDAADATADEIRKAKELLRANGYCLFGYREAGEKVKRTVGSGWAFVKEKGKAFGGWLSAKCADLKARQEEQRRVAAEKRRLAEEAEERRAKAETARGGAVSDITADDSGDVPKCAACGAEHVLGARFCRKCGKPVSVVRDASATEQPAEAKSESAAVEDSAGSDAPKCVACGAGLVPGARFCRKCGTPVSSVRDVPPAEAKSEMVAGEDSAGSGSGAQKCAVCGTALAVGMKFCGECGTPVHAKARKPRQRKTARPCKTSPSAEE